MNTIFLFLQLLMYQPIEHLVYHGTLVDVHASPFLYTTETSSHFFVKFTISNNTKQTVGVDISDYWRVFHPNQWGIYDQAQRLVIDERRLPPLILTPEKEQVIKQQFANNKLTLIPPNEKIEYYRAFNNGKHQDVQVPEGKFLIISLDGELLATDGAVVEHPCFENASVQRELVIAAEYMPWSWLQIPKNGHIVEAPH